MNALRNIPLDPAQGYVSHDRGRTVVWEPESVPVGDEEAAWVEARRGWQERGRAS